MDVKSSIIIYRSASAVFTYVRKPDQLTRWADTVVSAEFVEPVPIRRGTQFHVIHSFLGLPILTVDYSVIEFEENYLISAAGVSRRFRSRLSLTLSGADTGVRLTARAQIQADGLLRGIEPLIVPAVTSALGNSLDHLKRILEKV